MKRILAILCLSFLLISCGNVGKKFNQTNASSAGAASTTSTVDTSSQNSPTTGASTTVTGTFSSADSTGGETIEKPAPTAAQMATLEGGQEVKWDEQGMTWTLPKSWKKQTVESKMFFWSTTSGGDLGSLIVNISPMGSSFPTESSLKAYYTSYVDKKKNGEVEEVRWLEIDGVKGVAWREAMPEHDDDPRRLQWIGYRDYAGQTQMINLMLATKGKSFEKYQDTFYAVLYSTKIVH
ncbi:MAG TPA: hypothetical protein VF791_21510 [Pyrinomonadaceae bacterium]